jgi:chorismate mutase / prephenate dehydratase
MTKVSFQGEPGAYSEEAAIKEFGPNVNTVPHQSLREVFESVGKGETDAAVVPIENSLEGAVNETYDLLLERALLVTGEVKLRVEHCLIARPGSKLSGIKTVLSHPQALAQCRANLDALGVDTRPFYDTAGSVKFIAQSSDDSVAAIASARSARVYGMKILKTHMEDSEINYTRFLVLGTKSPKSPNRSESEEKTSLVFSTSHRPGALFDALEPFAKQKINLTKIESRPIRRTPWEYVFYLDFEGSVNDESVRRAVDTLKERVEFVKVLGSYPIAK